ncbi:MAG: endonuclease/exonuclease/phosphatase family protein [Bacteroidales bacterium]|nr:endonuclease/exonuclease/phosphatase family protein [Bacteroidales bacterium]
MKQCIYIPVRVWLVAALAIGLLPGCNGKGSMLDTDIETGSVDRMVLSASVLQQATKTALGTPSGGKYEVLWKTGDRISVNGSLSDNAVTAAENGTKTVDFTVSASLSAPYKVLCPGTSSANVISLPATQSYVANNIDGAAAASYGNAVKAGGKYTVSLSHFCGILRFALKGSAKISRIELNSLGSEKLFGNFTLATGSKGFTGAWSGGTAGTLTYNCNNVTLTGSDTYFYVAIPAQAYASGIEALVYQSDGAFMRLKFWGDGNTLSGNDLIEFESKTYAAGRTENLFSIGALTAENGGDPTASRPGVTVATYNIKQQDNRTGGDYSDYISMERADVKACLGSTIAAMGADIIGFNEFDSDYLSGGKYDLKALAEAGGMSSNYEWHLNYPNDTDRDGNWLSGYSYSASLDYANGFAFNKSTLTLNEDGYVWISNTENDYWSSAKNAYENSAGHHTVVWAKFTHKVSGKQFYFFVTHFDTYIGESAANQQKNTYNMQSLETFARAKVNGALPIIVVGDLNFGSLETDSPHDPVPNYTTLTSYWTDVWKKLNTEDKLTSFYQTYDGTLNGSSHKYYYSWTSFTKNKPWRRIDYILTRNGNSQGLTPSSYKTIRQTYTAEDDNPRCPSDHLPVIAHITFD